MRERRKDPFELDERAQPRNPSDNPTFESVVEARLTRRSLLKGAAGLAMLSAGMPSGARVFAATTMGEFSPIAASTEDRLILPPEYLHTVLLRWGDPLSPDALAFDPMAQTAAKQAGQFGFDCDFIGYFPSPMASGSCPTACWS